MLTAVPTYFRHTDGGIYALTCFGKHTEDASNVVVYRHVWPFEPDTWVRPASEWLSRFKHIPEAEVIKALKGDREAAQAAITAAKAKRRAAAASQ
ncbi:MULTISPECIES: DUF1653 domain-containing protein [unclassified Variovorax]|uniref:DUF1653 domain-containing protein n=1 Tax=unclassified Variovorax TaxID=663243 RepID=UPI00076CF775|nr:MULTISPECIES: DUF1653 domain-containing protein [unclassified Variovorax]KWT98015.1 hypothetical protein APY03_0686 [Variovorax sp. WDL1]PNG50516.1 hypothetical protein CHC06_06140 [Variovorax sp. B2]PNG51389.1 hypothetical protein CHC07_06046 [Variovorax sp. B4]VTU43003.1 hypothetical protein H6P1_00333 [Variovorax sp. PBL-H6]VTU43523.1 hypothetical protein SRS16P1_00572 [Variovorax sp. SRS16]